MKKEIATYRIHVPHVTRCAGWLAALQACLLAAVCAAVDGSIIYRDSASRPTRIACIIFGSVGVASAFVLLLGGISLARGKRAGRTTLLIAAWISLPLMFCAALICTVAASAGNPNDPLNARALNFHLIAAAACVAFVFVLMWLLLSGRTRDWSDAVALSRRPPLPPGLAPHLQVTALLSLIFAFLPPVLIMQMISLGMGLGALGSIRRSAGGRTGRVLAIIGVCASSVILGAIGSVIGVGVTLLYLETTSSHASHLVSQRLMEFNVAQQAYARMKLDPQSPGSDCTTSIDQLLLRTDNLNVMDQHDSMEIDQGHPFHGYHFSMVRYSDWGDEDQSKNWAILAWPQPRGRFHFGPPADAQMLESNGNIVSLRNFPGDMPKAITHQQIDQWRDEDSQSYDTQWMTDLDRPRNWTDAEASDSSEQPLTAPAKDGVGAALFNSGLAESVLPGRQLRAICWFRAYLAVAPEGPNADDATHQIEELDQSLSDRADAIVQRMTELASHFPDGSDQSDAAHKAIDEVQHHLDSIKQSTLACDVAALVPAHVRENSWTDYLQKDLLDPLADDAAGAANSSDNSPAIQKLQQRADDWLDCWQQVRQLLPEQNCLAGAKIQEQEEDIRCLAFSPDGKTLALGGHDHTVRLWDLAAGNETAKLEGHTDVVNCLAFAPDGSTLISGGATPDNAIFTWDVSAGKPLKTLTGHTSGLQSVLVLPDGQTIASAALDSTIRLWDIASGQQKSQFAGGDIGQLDDMAISPDGKTLATAGGDKIVRLWDVANQSETAELTGHTDAVNCVAFSPDGKTLASGGMDNTVRLWNLADKSQLASLEGHDQLIHAIKFSRDGHTLYSLSMDGSLRIWDLSTNKEKARLIMPDSTGSMTLSPDGHTLATGDDQSEVQLWHLP